MSLFTTENLFKITFIELLFDKTKLRISILELVIILLNWNIFKKDILSLKRFFVFAEIAERILKSPSNI